MKPTLLVGDHIVVDKTADAFSRGDVVVFEFPEDVEKPNPRAFIKRIVGLPGDEIEIRDKQLYVNGRTPLSRCGAAVKGGHCPDFSTGWAGMWIE